MPRGIDRIDIGYVSNLFETWPGECLGVLPTPWGVRFFPRERVLRARDRLAEIWQERDPKGEDPALVRLRARWIGGGTAEAPRNAAHPVSAEVADVLRALRYLFSEWPTPGRSITSLPRDALYLDVGHRGLWRPAALDWLDRRPDVVPVFMIHDAIPQSHPELVAPASAKRHATVLDVTARRARAVLTSTAAAAAEVGAELARRGRPDLPIHAVPLPIDDLFRRPHEPDPVIAAYPYFLACGTVEPRKNLEVLIEVWARLVADRGDAAPRLLIAGSTGSAFAARLRAGVEGRGLAGHVVFAAGLASPSIARLMAGARAVLMPSLAEGFGLPPIEALTMGTPAVVSDIPAHRDAAGGAALFAATDDVDAWMRAIGGLAHDTPLRAEALRRAASLPQVDWHSYMAVIRGLLADIR